MKSIKFVFNQKKLSIIGKSEDDYMNIIKDAYTNKPIREIEHNYFVCDDSENALVFLYQPVHDITKKDYKFIEVLDECILTLGEEVDDVIKGTLRQYKRRGIII